MKSFAIALVLSLLCGCAAKHTPSTSASSAPSQSPHFRGFVLDPTGAIIAGLNLELRSGNQLIATARSTRKGEYDFGAVSPADFQIVAKNSDDWCDPKVKDGVIAGTRDIYLGLCPRSIAN